MKDNSLICLRGQIDEIDEELCVLLKKRFSVCRDFDCISCFILFGCLNAKRRKRRQKSLKMLKNNKTCEKLCCSCVF